MTAHSSVPAQPQAPTAPPSAGWTSPDRPELSPEHVALLTWWADMIAKGQFPAPAAAPEAAPASAGQTSRRRRTGPKRPAPATASSAAAQPDPDPGPDPQGSRRRTALVALGLGGIAAAGLAFAFGPSVVSAFTEEPAAVPASNLMMPTSVGGLVAVSSPDVSEQLQPLIGLGLRPAGITTTAAYAADPASPVVLAALATTTAPDADATGQINQWAARMGAQVGEPAVGGSGTGGVTCAEVGEIPNGLPGSFCVWTGSDRRGQAYVVGSAPESALELVAQLRSGVTAAP